MNPARPDVPHGKYRVTHDFTLDVEIVLDHVGSGAHVIVESCGGIGRFRQGGRGPRNVRKDGNGGGVY